jgi:hypothetical protein
MKVLFLDIDGVLNSRRSCVANYGYPHDFSQSNMRMFDVVALGLIQRLCQLHLIKVVISSSWRNHHPWQEIGKGLDLPVIDSTPRLVGPRGKEIAAWLEAHPEVETYAILDDDPDMLPDQQGCFVHTNGMEGLLFRDFLKLCAIFGVSAYDDGPAPRVLSAKKLDWNEA